MHGGGEGSRARRRDGEEPPAREWESEPRGDCAGVRKHLSLPNAVGDRETGDRAHGKRREPAGDGAAVDGGTDAGGEGGHATAATARDAAAPGPSETGGIPRG
eukprot:gene14298-biopygen1032